MLAVIGGELMKVSQGHERSTAGIVSEGVALFA